jgi:phosphoribosylformylglycinamidine synthase subunit PurS
VAASSATAGTATPPTLTAATTPAEPTTNVEGVRAKVLIRPKRGILDPQGKAIERALPALGFDGVSNVRVGRLVELEADDPEGLADLCEKLLANPLIEDYEIELDGS